MKPLFRLLTTHIPAKINGKHADTERSMKPLNDFAHKQSKYMPTFAKATGKPTVYIPGYPYEDEEPMPATGFHGNRSAACMNNLPVISQRNHTSMSVLTISSTTVKAMSRKASPPIFMLF